MIETRGIYQATYHWRKKTNDLLWKCLILQRFHTDDNNYYEAFCIGRGLSRSAVAQVQDWWWRWQWWCLVGRGLRWQRGFSSGCTYAHICTFALHNRDVHTPCIAVSWRTMQIMCNFVHIFCWFVFQCSWYIDQPVNVLLSSYTWVRC